jgi:hypothetical protein
VGSNPIAHPKTILDVHRSSRQKSMSENQIDRIQE